MAAGSRLGRPRVERASGERLAEGAGSQQEAPRYRERSPREVSAGRGRSPRRQPGERSPPEALRSSWLCRTGTPARDRRCAYRRRGRRRACLKASHCFGPPTKPLWENVQRPDRATAKAPTRANGFVISSARVAGPHAPRNLRNGGGALVSRLRLGFLPTRRIGNRRTAGKVLSHGYRTQAFAKSNGPQIFGDLSEHARSGAVARKARASIAGFPGDSSEASRPSASA